MGGFAASPDYLFWMLSGMPPGEPDVRSEGPVAAPHEADLELVRRLLARDRKAIADFVAEHADAIHGYVQFRLSPHTESTDDVAQEVFLAAWKGLGAYRGDNSLRNWLLGIARHKIEDLYRRQLREPDPLPAEDSGGQTLADEPLFEAEIDSARLRERAAAVLKDLPPAHSAVLLWRYWDHRSLGNIALTIGKTEKAVERLLSRARESFRRRWESGRP